MSTLFISRAGAERAGNDVLRRDAGGAYMVKARTEVNTDTRRLEQGFAVLIFDKPAGVYAYTL